MSHEHNSRKKDPDRGDEQDEDADRTSLESSEKEADDSDTKARETPEADDNNSTQGDRVDEEGYKPGTPTESNHEDDDLGQEGIIDPEDFDSKSFLSSVSDLSVKLQSESFKRVDSDFPVSDLKEMVKEVTTVMTNFQNYARHTQSQLEGVREQMREIKDRVYKRIQAKGYDPRSAHEKKSLEERELDAKLAQLNKEVAKSAEDVIRGSQISLDTESAAVEASLVAEQAAEDARRIQAEYEARRKAEAEARKAEDERRETEKKRREEDERRQEEIRKTEDNRISHLRKPDENKGHEWDNWPTFTYNIEENEYNQGIGCIVRGEASRFKENMATIERSDPLEVTSFLSENEELVSDIINFGAAQEDNKLPKSIYVAIPHCTSRASGMSREPVIKAEVNEGKWEELKSQEVTLDGYKDVKFIQAEVKSFGHLCVVTRYKRDFLHLTKRGGKVPSNVDARVSFTVERGTFKKPENFVLQLQPIDSATIGRVKERSAEATKLLTSSSVVNMEWTSKAFDNPVTMTLPCPPNPVKAKKAAAARAAKEAKMKNPAHALPPAQEDTQRRRNKAKQAVTDDDERPSTGVTKWYMGQYGNDEDDENDSLFFLKKMINGKWQCLEHMVLLQTKLDLVQFRLHEPVSKFMVLRTRTNADARVAQCLAETIETCLKERVIGVLMRQRGDNPSDAVLTAVPTNRLDKTFKYLEELGFELENQSQKDATIKILNEGDTLEATFRGNIKCADKNARLEFTFHSQMKSQLCFPIVEVNRYLQRGFSDYKGYVQLVKKTTTVRMPTKKGESEGEAEPRVEVHRTLISEHVVQIPKPEEESRPRTPVKARVVIKNEDHCLDEDNLRHIAQSLGDEWYKVANYLNVRRQRVQAILRNNSSADEEEIKFQMLITWLKKVPRSQNKVEVLRTALKYSNRPELADELNQMEEEFQSQRRGGRSSPHNNHDRTSLRSGSRASLRDDK